MTREGALRTAFRYLYSVALRRLFSASASCSDRRRTRASSSSSTDPPLEAFSLHASLSLLLLPWGSGTSDAVAAEATPQSARKKEVIFPGALLSSSIGSGQTRRVTWKRQERRREENELWAAALNQRGKVKGKGKVLNKQGRSNDHMPYGKSWKMPQEAAGRR